MNLDVANTARQWAARYREIAVPGHEESFERLAGMAEDIEQCALNDAADDDLMCLVGELQLADRVVAVGLANDRIARAAGFSDSEGGHPD